MPITTITHEEDPLLDLFEVGSKKCLGFLLLSDLEKLANVVELVQSLEQQDKKCLTIFCPPYNAEALFVFAPSMLQALLEENREVIESCGWPRNANEFVLRAASESIPTTSAPFDVIAKAYGNDPEEVKKEIEKVNDIELLHMWHEMNY